MNDLENYKTILDKYFGVGTSTFATASGSTKNNIISALNDPQFGPFRSAFEKRLARLAARYPVTHTDRKELTIRANDIATNNWDGAYAELVAFDFLNSDRNYLSGPISLSKTVPASDTLAAGLGMKNVNLDGYYDDFDVWFDVKILADKSRDILDGIIAEVTRKLKISSATVNPEYPLDLDYALVQQNRKALAAELENALTGQTQPSFIQSLVIPELAYRLIWGSGVLMTVSTYHPYIHAEKHHPLLFSHAKKFSRVSPAFIVFVVFPWFSEKVVAQTNSSETFYRAFSRRFFCQYTKDSRPAKTLLKSFAGTETLSQVTDKLSGVIFLEDRCVTSPEPDQQNVRGFTYLNPNAAHKIGGLSRDYLSGLGLLVDDLEHDNY